MLKSLFPQADWASVKVVGFDMDGTLYDELDFIVQVYRPIAKALAQGCSADVEKLYSWLMHRWLEKGSSYNRIFDEVLQLHAVAESSRQLIIEESLNIYRNYLPSLSLTNRTKLLLDYFKGNYDLFLISDGNCKLQMAKFHALGLANWFMDENVAVSGCYGSDFNKPSIKMINKIKILESAKPQSVLFFGDRDIDRQFAQNAGYQFICVSSMVNKS